MALASMQTNHSHRVLAHGPIPSSSAGDTRAKQQSASAYVRKLRSSSTTLVLNQLALTRSLQSLEPKAPTSQRARQARLFKTNRQPDAAGSTLPSSLSLLFCFHNTHLFCMAECQTPAFLYGLANPDHRQTSDCAVSLEKQKQHSIRRSLVKPPQHRPTGVRESEIHLPLSPSAPSLLASARSPPLRLLQKRERLVSIASRSIPTTPPPPLASRHQ